MVIYIMHINKVEPSYIKTFEFLQVRKKYALSNLIVLNCFFLILECVLFNLKLLFWRFAGSSGLIHLLFYKRNKTHGIYLTIISRYFGSVLLVQGIWKLEKNKKLQSESRKQLSDVALARKQNHLYTFKV